MAKPVQDLSGGEVQITALIRRCNSIRASFCPTSRPPRLDPQTAMAVEDLLCRWVEECHDRALVWVSHDAGQADRMGQIRVRMEAGRIVAQES